MHKLIYFLMNVTISGC